MSDGHAILARTLTAAAPSLEPGSKINPANVHSWTFLTDDTLPRGYVVYTSWSPWPFSPAYGLPGTPLHFETLVCNRSLAGFGGNSTHYATEAEARDGHAVMVQQTRAHAEALAS